MYLVKLIYFEMSFLRINCRKFKDYLVSLIYCFLKEIQILDIVYMLSIGLSLMMSFCLNNVFDVFYYLCQMKYENIQNSNYQLELLEGFIYFFCLMLYQFGRRMDS